MTSEDDREIDIETDEDEISGSTIQQKSNNGSHLDKRAHHNALERKRRDHIKDSFCFLRDAIPSLKGEKQVSRAQILNKATDYIQYMRQKNLANQAEIEETRRQNAILEQQVRHLEKAKAMGKTITEADLANLALLTSDSSFIVNGNDAVNIMNDSSYLHEQTVGSEEVISLSPDVNESNSSKCVHSNQDSDDYRVSSKRVKSTH